MKLTIASASIAFLCPPAISASIVAANINKHENNKGSIRPSATKKKESTSIAALRAPAISASIVDVNLLEHENNKGFVHPSATKNKECAFVNGVEVSVAKSEDVGILSCEIGELCAEDTTSSLGGRCVSVASNPDALGTQRELADPCEKCKGVFDSLGALVEACVGVSDSDKSNNIACGSCIGAGACNNLASGVTIGADSCVGSHACLEAKGNIGENSCRQHEDATDANQVCAKIEGNIGDNSCKGYRSCAFAVGNIGYNSCSGDDACADAKGNIGANSCTAGSWLDPPCTYAYVNIGDGSCNGYNACQKVEGDDVPNDSCNGNEMCQNTFALPSDPPSAEPSFKPSSQPSESPFSQPSSQPSEKPSDMPSESPSSQPSSQPSESPSSKPSSQPSEQPSGMPSELPSSTPSSEPSGTPSCTPSSAPTPSPSINLFYPDQSESGKCLNDGGQPAWMEANPSAWLSTTLEKCCTQHASWNLPDCVGSHPQECATTLWYPDWAGTNKGCLRDGNEPLYMVQSPSNFIFSDKASCCAEHYSWNEASCLGGIGGTSISHGTATTSSGTKYYADWSSGDETCKNDGAAPEYMINNAATWLWDQLSECCEKHFNYKLAECKGSSTATSAEASPYAGFYYPDWAGDNEGCEVNSGTTLAPDYMSSASNANHYLFATLNECCEKHYSWNESSCKNGGSSATTGVGTEKWYVKWSDGTCYKDCAVGGTDCGGLAGYYETNNLHDTKAKCCSTHLSYDYKNCLN